MIIYIFKILEKINKNKKNEINTYVFILKLMLNTTFQAFYHILITIKTVEYP